MNDKTLTLLVLIENHPDIKTKTFTQTIPKDSITYLTIVEIGFKLKSSIVG